MDIFIKQDWWCETTVDGWQQTALSRIFPHCEDLQRWRGFSGTPGPPAVTFKPTKVQILAFSFCNWLGLMMERHQETQGLVQIQKTGKIFSICWHINHNFPRQKVQVWDPLSAYFFKNSGVYNHVAVTWLDSLVQGATLWFRENGGGSENRSSLVNLCSFSL